MRLPEEHVPFPVEPRYSVRPTLRRWDAGDRGHLRLDARYPEYLTEKLRLLRSDPDGCRVLSPDVDRRALAGALLRVAEGLALDAAIHGAHDRAQDGAVRETPARTAGRTLADGILADGTPAGRTSADGTSAAARQTPSPLAPIVVDDGGVRFPLLGIALHGPGWDLSRHEPAVGVDGLSPDLVARVADHLAGLEPLERLADALALAVQEDLVVMAGAAPPAPAAPAAPAGRSAPAGAAAPTDVPSDVPADVPSDGRAELLHVCFPSAWDPAARAGAGFVALHAPVPHNAALSSAAGRVVQAMVAKGPFVRYVWSLAADDALDRNPRRLGGGPPPSEPASVWFRVERQTVLPLTASQRALFTIRVYRAPLPSVLTSPERGAVLASALRSMDTALLAYKGVGGLRSALLAYLDDRAG